MPANLITTGNVYDKQYFTKSASDSSVVSVSYNSYTTEHFSVRSTLGYDGTSKIGLVETYNLPGAWIHTSILPASSVEQNASYVVSFKARNNTEYEADVNFAVLIYQDGNRDARWIWGFIRDIHTSSNRDE